MHYFRFFFCGYPSMLSNYFDDPSLLSIKSSTDSAIASSNPSTGISSSGLGGLTSSKYPSSTYRQRQSGKHNYCCIHSILQKSNKKKKPKMRTVHRSSTNSQNSRGITRLLWLHKRICLFHLPFAWTGQ